MCRSMGYIFIKWDDCHILTRYSNIFRFSQSCWDRWVSSKWQHFARSTRQRAPLRQEQCRPLSESLELPFRVNANWYLKFCGVIFTFVAIVVIVEFALLSHVTSVSVEPTELAVNPRGGWLSALTVYCEAAASRCAWVGKWIPKEKLGERKR